MLTNFKRPVCNFCGNLCGMTWFQKKPHPQSAAAKDEAVTKAVGEYGSLHQVLRSLTQAYVTCRDCFTQGNFPQILSAYDFEQ
jgi:hypothetical protein